MIKVFTLLLLVSNLSAEFYSQKGQDEWVIQDVFKGKRCGYFVDLGASGGIIGSNTYALETEYEWKGICIEPNPTFFKELKGNRQCLLLNKAVDFTNHRIEFLFEGMALGGIVDRDTDNNFQHRSKLIREARARKGVMFMETVTLEQVLEEANAPHVIDFLSLDVEGSETRILRDFPFEEYTFLAMAIERPTEELNQILFANGYVFVKNQTMDTFYVHESIPNLKEIKKEPFSQIPKKDW